MAHRLAIGFVVDNVKYTDRLSEEFINSGVYLKDSSHLVGNYLRVTGVRIVEFPTLEVYTEKLYNLSDSDFEDLGLSVLSNAKDCYIYCSWDSYNSSYVNFVIRDYRSKKLSIVSEKFLSIAFAELENGDLLFNCGQFSFTTNCDGKIHLDESKMDSDRNFVALDLASSYCSVIINDCILPDLVGKDSINFYYAFGKGFYLALKDCIVWTNIADDSIVYKGNVLHNLICKCILDYSLSLFDELECLFDITNNLVSIGDFCIPFLEDENKELILPCGCKYVVCSDRYAGFSNYSNVVFSPNISYIVFDYYYKNSLGDLGKHGDKKKYSNCTFYFSRDTSVNFFIDSLFNQFLTYYIYKIHKKENQIECYTDFRDVTVFGRSHSTTMTEKEFEVSKSNLLKGIKTAENFIKRFGKILPVKIELY